MVESRKVIACRLQQFVNFIEKVFVVSIKLDVKGFRMKLLSSYLTAVMHLLDNLQLIVGYLGRATGAAVFFETTQQ